MMTVNTTTNAATTTNSAKESSSSYKAKQKAALYSFAQARKIARGHSFESVQEFLDYTCPGAYQLPKNPNQVWALEWQGWDDFLGLTPDFDTGRVWARNLGLTSEQDYMRLFEQHQLDDDDPASRLPYRPDLMYKDCGWQGWQDWLGY